MDGAGRQVTPANLQAGELSREMEGVNRVLANTAVLLAGLDQADSARELRNLTYSPLRTAVEQAVDSAARVTEFLRAQARM